MSFTQKRKGSLQKKILKTISLLILIPMVILAIISIVQLNTLGDKIGVQGTTSLENERTQILLNKSQDAGDYLNSFFEKVESDLNRLAIYEEKLFNNSIEVLDNRPSYRQGSGSTPPDLTTSTLYSGSVSMEFSDYVNISILAGDQTTILQRSAYMDYISAEVLQNNPEYSSISIVFESGLSRVFPYIQLGRLQNEDMRNEIWYSQAKTLLGQIYYSNPDNGLIGPSITLVRAVYNGTSLLGTVAIEVKLASLRSAIQNMLIYEDGYITIINSNEIALIHPNIQSTESGVDITNLETSTDEFSSIVSDIIGGNSAIAQFTKNNDEYLVAYSPILRGNIYSVAIVSYDDISAPGVTLLDRINELITPTIIWFAVVIIALIGILFAATIYISKKITQPINALTTSVEKMSRGDLSQEISIDKRNQGNEIGLMALSFQNLLVTMRFGNKSYYQGDLLRAYDNYQAAIQLFETLDNKKGLGTCLNNIGNIYRNWGDFQKAENAYNRSIEIGKTLQDTPGLAARYNNRGLLNLNLNRIDAAKADFETALKLDESLGDEIQVAVRKRNLGILFTLENNELLAKQYLNEAFETNKKLENSSGLAEDYFQLGRFYLSYHKLELAEENFKEALKIAESMQNYPLMQNIFSEMIELYEETDNRTLLYRAQSELGKIKDLLVQKKNVVFVIDLSGSMIEHGKIKAAKRGALELYESTINNKDNIAIIGFHSKIDQILPLTQKGPHIQEIRSTIEEIQATPYQTIFYDAVGVGIDILKNIPGNEQLWLVALTDGLDNLSQKYDANKLAKLIKTLKKPLNMILIGVGPELRQVANQFIHIVDASPRGKYIPIYSIRNVKDQIDRAFKQVQKIMASSEIEGFTPEES